MKSISIKTNNQVLKEYLLKKLDLKPIKSTVISVCKFKIYDNIIIHYLADNNSLFLKEISCILANAVIDLYEDVIIKKMLDSNYFYFSYSERNEINDKCTEELNFNNDFDKFNFIAINFYDYLIENKYLIFEGFLTFRLNQYMKFLDSIIDISVNKFIIEREYLEFVNLLKTYISSKPSGANLIHLIYDKNNSTILDENQNLIKSNLDNCINKYVSDITFSSNDYALNTLLSILPQKLIIHIKDKEDEFINTLKLIFTDRITICND